MMLDSVGWTTITKKKKMRKPKEEESSPLPRLLSTTSSRLQMKQVVFEDEVYTMRKLEAANEPVKQKYLSLETRQEITNRRVSNKWTQADLNKYCAFPTNTIRDIESGRIPPTSQQLGVLNRILKGGIYYS